MGRVQRLPELGVLAHAVAVAANRDERAVMDEAIDERLRHDLIAEDVAPLLETHRGWLACFDPGLRSLL